MTTLATMKARIARETMNRDDLATEIAEAITSAIETYQSRRFYFNENRTVTFTTAADQDIYEAAADPHIPDILDIDGLTLIHDGHVRELVPEGIISIEGYNSNTFASTSVPSTYSYYGQQLRLSPIPDGAYQVRLHGHVRIAAPETESEADNPWMTDAERLIRACAHVQLRQSIEDDIGAQRWEQREARALDELKTESNRRQSVFYIKAHAI